MLDLDLDVDLVRFLHKNCITPRGAHLRMTYLRNIDAHNAYNVIQDGAEKVHERLTTNDKISYRFSSTGQPRLGCVFLTSNATKYSKLLWKAKISPVSITARDCFL